MISRRLFDRNDSVSLILNNNLENIIRILSPFKIAYYKEDFDLVSHSEQISCSHRRNKPEIYPPEPKGRSPFRKKKEKTKIPPLYTKDDEDIPSDYELDMAIKDWTPEENKKFEDVEKDIVNQEKGKDYDSFEINDNAWKKGYGQFSQNLGKDPYR